jgi:hypothetical protein
VDTPSSSPERCITFAQDTPLDADVLQISSAQ